MTAAILLITPLTSCATTKVEARVVVPGITFPIFPDLTGAEETESGVVVPKDWIVSLARYRILIEETEKNYNEIKALYDKGSE